jgi:hypothetical protein|tara:strand:- start:245 stop:913 length:669 start_codon:yes stop_codon:yes gene_type:complete
VLGLGVGFYGVGGKTYPGGGWLPTDESSLEAWYKFGGPTKNPVDVWPDESGNDHHMLQSTSGNQPSNSAGVITFDGSDHLESVTDITLTDSLTVGIKLNTSDPTNAFLGDNDSNNNFYKQLDADTFRFRNTAGLADVDLNGGNSFGDNYLVITRDGSNAFKIWLNGVEQADTATRGGDSIINAIGVKNPDADDFIGDIYEIQIYSSTSADLTANINARLAGL